MNLEIYIEELVLQGFDPSDDRGIGDALERELARLIADQGIPSSFKLSGEIDGIDGGAFEMAPGSGAKAIGNKVAQSVYGGLRR